MTKTVQDFSVPFKTTLSFSNIIGYWEAKTYDENEFVADNAKNVLKQIKEFPELLGDIEDPSVLEGKQDIISLIMSSLVPQALIEDSYMAGVDPFGVHMFYMTKPMQQLIDEAGSFRNMLRDVDAEEMVRLKTVFAYLTIFKDHYGKEIPVDKPMIATITDQKTGLPGYFKVNVNTRFCQSTLHGKLPKLTPEVIETIKDNVFDVSVWESVLPHDLFEFKGFAIYSLINVTRQEVLSGIKESLLKPDSLTDTANFYSLEKEMQSLLRIKDLRLGIAGYQKNQKSFVNFGKKICRSLLLQPGKEFICDGGKMELYEKFSANPEPVVIENINNSDLVADDIRKKLDDGVLNLLLAPLYYGNDFIGLLELGSPNPGDLNRLTINNLQEIFPLFAVAVKRSAEELENRVQSVIKEQYTSIHHTVEWKFLDAAHRFIDREERGENPEPDPIIFEDVYPIYGASDIRNSSTERNKAILSDLRKQLRLAKQVLSRAHELKGLPIIKEIEFRLEQQISKLKRGLISGDEMAILEFLQHDVEPVLRNIESNHPDFKVDSDKYWSALDEKYMAIHDSRKEFEDSLTRINEVVSNIIDVEEELAQQMHPHFFEKYKTDGVEYNIYIGASLTQDTVFDELYLRNMRLWQLLTTCEIARQTAKLVPELSLPLETTHLILVHSNPLAIRFRMDEKQFDVDGAYNIRYEIIKKRIDKALIKDTNERLTQPGMIAIVYSQDKDAEEYRKYLAYLQANDFLLGEIEHLELEELQGVSGLKALRVKVAVNEQTFSGTLEKIMAEV